MFEGLREKLQKISAGLEQGIRSGSATAEVSEEPGQEQARKDPNLLGKVKVLITDREFVISEKEIAEPLAELELVLLENDVALPVTVEIIAQVRSRLVGKRRKIGENVDILVISALRESLL